MDSSLPPENPTETAAPGASAPGPFRTYFRTLKMLLSHPGEYFRALRLPVNPAFALVFALATHWIGSALEYLWTLAFARSMNLETGHWREIFRKLVNQIDSTDRMEALSAIQERAMHWVMGAGSVVIDPFKTIVKILIQTLVLWIAARIFVPRHDSMAEEVLSYRTSLAIVCFSMAPAILAGVPFVGPFVAPFFTLVLMVIGAREVYRVRPGRAALIVLFPHLVVLFLVLFVLAAVSVAIFKLMINFVGP